MCSIDYQSMLKDSLFDFTKKGLLGGLKFYLKTHPCYFTVNTKNEKGYSLLAVAVIFGHDDIVEYLIKEGADIHHQVQDGKTILHIAAFFGRFTMIHKLLGEDGSLLNKQTSTGKTPLYYSCQNGYYLATTALLKSGANVNIPDKNGITPIYLSCQQGSLWNINTLINYGANLEYVTKDGFTPLLLACQLKKWNVINILLQKGACVNHSSTDGILSPVKTLAGYGSDIILEKLITDFKAEINVDESLFSPLYCATKNDRFSTMKLLVKNGAVLDLRTKSLIEEKIRTGNSKSIDFLQKFLDYKEIHDFLSDIEWNKEDQETLMDYTNDIFGKDFFLTEQTNDWINVACKREMNISQNTERPTKRSCK